MRYRKKSPTGFITDGVKKNDIVVPKKLDHYDGYHITYGKKYKVIKVYLSYVVIIDDINITRFVLYSVFDDLLLRRTNNINSVLV